MSILLVILIFSMLVFVHELGHFLVAKRAGIKVEEFGFGFPPRLFGFRRGETVYSLNLLPFGGFVRLLGEGGESENNPRSYSAQPVRTRFNVIAAGVLMNLITAWLLFSIAALIGMPPVTSEKPFVGGKYLHEPHLEVFEMTSDSPAAVAGIKIGDGLYSGRDNNGEVVKFESAEQLSKYTKEHAGQEIAFETGPYEDRQEKIIKLRETNATGGYLGVTPFVTSKTIYPVWAAPLAGLKETVSLSVQTVVALGKFFIGLGSTGQVSEDVAGPVGIVLILRQLMKFGISFVLIFIASISVSLAVLNILPIPALDGGRILFLIYNKLSEIFNFRRISQVAENKFHTLGFVSLLILMVLITVSDLGRYR